MRDEFDLMPPEDAARYVNSAIAGCHAIFSLDLRSGDTLVLAQLGDPKFSQSLIDSLPEGISIVDLDFSGFCSEGMVGTSLVNDRAGEFGIDESPVTELLPTNIDRDLTRMPFEDFIEHAEDFIDSKPEGTIKCFFDLSEYRTVDRGRHTSTDDEYVLYHKTEVDDSNELVWESYSIDWSSLGEFTNRYLHENGPELVDYAWDWGALLYVLLATHISGNGIAASLVPEKYLSDTTYEDARGVFLRRRFVRRVAYLPKTNAYQDQQDLVITSQVPSKSVGFVRDSTFGPAGMPFGISGFSQSSSLIELSEHTLPFITSQVSREYNGPNVSRADVDIQNQASSRTILKNESRLSYESSRLYIIAKRMDCRLGEVASKVAPPKPNPQKPDLFESDCFDRQLPAHVYREHASRFNESNKSGYNHFLATDEFGRVSRIQDSQESVFYLAVSTSSFDGSGAFRENGDLFRGASPDVYGTLLSSIPPEDCLLKPFDVLVSRVNRNPSNRRTLHERLLARPKLAIVPETAATKNPLVCAASSICLRSLTDDPVHSLVLYYYLSKGRGNRVLSALATQYPTLTWNKLESLPVDAALNPSSSEWQERRESFIEQAQKLIQLQSERCELLEKTESEESAMAKLISSL